MAVKKGLGRGLDSLFMDNTQEISENTKPQSVKLTEIEPNKNQPRKEFDSEALSNLAESIREHGLIQPLTVRPLENGRYQIVAGERRWRASRMAGLSEVPVVIMDIDEKTTMELALIENLQREDLNAIEEALGYKDLIETYKMTQADVSKSVGKSRSVVANALRLLNLPNEVITLVNNGKISRGHARALLSLEDENIITEVAKDIIKKDLTVRDVEKLGKAKDTSKTKPSVKKHDSFFDEMEIALKEELHRKIKITERNGKGIIEVPFFSKEELSDIAKRLARIFD